MQPLSFENIQPLIAEEQVRGTEIVCVFRCPVTGLVVESSAPIPPEEDNEILLLPKSVDKRGGFLEGARFSLFGLIKGMPSEAANTVENPLFSEVALRRATVSAFRQVRNRFRWEEEATRWVAIPPVQEEITAVPIDFEGQMHAAPILERGDRNILLRLLLEIAHADARLSSDEKSFLGEFLDPYQEVGEQVLYRHALTREELRRTSRGPVRETILMLAWGLALTDEDLAISEQKRLEDVAADLGIPDSRSTEIKQLAQVFLLEAVMEQAAQTVRAKNDWHDQVATVAQRIGLSPEDTEKAIEQFLVRE